MAPRAIDDIELQRRIDALHLAHVCGGVSVEQRWVVTRPMQDLITREWRSEVLATFFTEQEAERAARELMMKEEESNISN